MDMNYKGEKVMYETGTTLYNGNIVLFDQGDIITVVTPKCMEFKANYRPARETLSAIGYELPTIGELDYIYDYLFLENIGSFEDDIYWTDEEPTGTEAKAVNFGKKNHPIKSIDVNFPVYVRGVKVVHKEMVK